MSTHSMGNTFPKLARFKDSVASGKNTGRKFPDPARFIKDSVASGKNTGRQFPDPARFMGVLH